MKTLKTVLYESLLDDFDDLEKNADTVVKIHQTVGHDYNLRYVYTSGPTRYFCNTFDKRKIKKYTENLYWKNQEIYVYDSGMRII